MSVIDSVIQTASLPAPEASLTASFQVEAPRLGDAIGAALRNAYARDIGMPQDMAALLSRLDDTPSAAQ